MSVPSMTETFKKEQNKGLIEQKKLFRCCVNRIVATNFGCLESGSIYRLCSSCGCSWWSRCWAGHPLRLKHVTLCWRIHWRWKNRKASLSLTSSMLLLCERDLNANQTRVDHIDDRGGLLSHCKCFWGGAGNVCYVEATIARGLSAALVLVEIRNVDLVSFMNDKKEVTRTQSKVVSKLREVCAGDGLTQTFLARKMQKTFRRERSEAMCQAIVITTDRHNGNARFHEVLATLSRIAKAWNKSKFMPVDDLRNILGISNWSWEMI